MESKQFKTIAAEIEQLLYDIDRASDTCVRVTLLKELTAKLRKLDRMAKAAIAEASSERESRD